MAHATYNDISPFYRAHPPGDPAHVSYVVGAGGQLHLICVNCGIDVTADAVDAGLPVVVEEEAI